jgi:hypothetical protein
MQCWRKMEKISWTDRVINEVLHREETITIIKEIEQNQLTWHGHVQRMVEGRLPKTALKRDISYIQQKEGRLTGLVTSCIGTAF